MYFDIDTTVTLGLSSDQARLDEDTDQNTTEISKAEANTTSGLSSDEGSISLEEQDYTEGENLIQSELKQAENRSTSIDNLEESDEEINYGINPRHKCKYLKIHQIEK